MNKQNHNYFTGIEIGTEKLCVLHAAVNEKNEIEVLSFASKDFPLPPNFATFRGQIQDKNLIIKTFQEVMEQSERNPSFINIRSEHRPYFLINGPHIRTQQGRGDVLIKDQETRIVSEEDLSTAMKLANNLVLTQNLRRLDSYDGYFMLDEIQVSHPIGKTADKISACPLIVFAPENHFRDIQEILTCIGGYEYTGVCTFSPIASCYSVLTRDELENGALLFDFGAGMSSYALVYQNGFLLAGTIPIGVHHLINDLSVGLDLPFAECREILINKKLNKYRKSGLNYYELKKENKVLRIPLDSFDRILEVRIQELFEIMNGILEKRNLKTKIKSSIVLTGGGSKIETSTTSIRKLMKNVFEVNEIRCGEPLNVCGVLNDFKRPLACYSSIFGLIKLAAEQNAMTDRNSFRFGLDNFFSSLFDKSKDLISKKKK